MGYGTLDHSQQDFLTLQGLVIGEKFSIEGCRGQCLVRSRYAETMVIGQKVIDTLEWEYE